MATYRNKRTGEIITLTPEQESELFRQKVLQLSAGQQEGAFGTVATFKGAKDLVDLLDAGLETGPLSGARQRAEQVTSGENEQFNQFRSGVTQLTANFIKALSGVQVSDKERKFLMGALPSPYKQEQVNRDGIKTLLKFLKDKYETQIGTEFNKFPSVVPLHALGGSRISVEQSQRPTEDRGERLNRFAQEQTQLDKDANRSVFSRFAEELPKGLARAFVKEPARFAASAAVAPVDIARGVAGQKPLDVNIPGVGGTFQGEAQKRLDEGASPLATVGRATLEVPLVGLETLGIGKIAKTGVVGAKRLFQARRTASEISHAVDAVSPALNKAGRIEAFARAGKPGGVAKGRFGAVKRTPSNEDIEIAKAASPFVKGSNAVKHAENLGGEIVRHSDEVVRPYLRSNPRAFNTATLNKHLSQVDPPDWIKSDATAERTYNLIKQRMIDATRNHPNNMEGLWDSRITFDKIVKQQFGEAKLDPARRGFVERGIRDMRDAVHDFITQQTGDSQFKANMKYLSRLYRAIDNIADKNQAIVEAPTKVRRLFGSAGRQLGSAALLGGAFYAGSKLTGQR